MNETTVQVVVGLEVHVQLKTATKLFCRCETRFGAPPNTQVCPTCLGLPGSLPVINAAAVDLAVLAGLGMNCDIASYTKWDRKNYFYPDLPKGYQISQFDLPICGEGYVEIDLEEGGVKHVRLFRAHLEEDAGKSLHDEAHGRGDTRIDLNRTGTPLLEIVSQPDIASPDEARAYLTELKMLMEHLDISDCNMQEGSLRVDANVNLHIAHGDNLYETPIVEVKNLNSFRAVERAIKHEAERQYVAWRETGATRHTAPKQTVGWDDAVGATVVQREKEDSADYRYFPDPDLAAVAVSDERVEQARGMLGELPRARRLRFEEQYRIRREDAMTICQQGRAASDYFDSLIAAGASPKRATAWMLQDVLRTLNERQIGVDDLPVSAPRLAGLIKAIDDGELDSARGREVFAYLETHPEASASDAIAALGIKRAGGDEVESLCRELLAANPDVIAKVRGGNAKALGALVGPARKKNPNADPRQVQEVCLRLIERSEV